MATACAYARVRIIASWRKSRRGDKASQRLYVGLLPSPYPGTRRVKDSFVVAFADAEARLGCQLRPYRVPQVIDAQLGGLIGRRHVVGTEQESFWMAVEHVRHALFDLGARNGV